ncbi:MAG: ankyrin repeat domain-containing protein [Desulfobacterales bacterium]|nr:ankyrin repeat domain-containing protein [Desulfobacterales bacterium]
MPFPPNVYQELVDAVKLDDAAKVLEMLKGRFDLNDFPNPHPVTVASRYGHLETFKALLAAGADVNKKYSGEPPLVTAAWSGRIPLVQFLLASGADIHAATHPERNTALMMAAVDGRVDTVDILLNAGALPNARNSKGFTALMFAAKSGNYKIARLLIDRQADIHAKNQEGQTALDLAVKYRNVPVAELLNPEVEEKMMGCEGKKYKITSVGGRWKNFKGTMAADISSLPWCFTFRKFHYEFWIDRHDIMPHMIIAVFDNSIGICDLGAPDALWSELKNCMNFWVKKYDPDLTMAGPIRDDP